MLSSANGQAGQNSAPQSQTQSDQVFQPDSTALDSSTATLIIPNVFTPNGDGIHDYFEVETNGITVYDFNIFTRTGTQIFHSNSPRIFWDGTNSAGLDLEEGVYYYVIEEEKGESKPYSSAGFIYLFR